MPKRTIGVVGLTGAGKTTLLTSLLSHLDHHDPDQFPIGQNGTTTLFQQLPTRPGEKAFPYRKLRQQLAAGFWVAKTLELQTCRAGILLHNGTPQAKFDLTIHDIPGERLTDIEIAQFADFSQWSDHALERLTDPDFKDIPKSFLIQLEQAETLVARDSSVAGPEDLSALLQSYKDCLADLISDHVPAITPSSFWVNAQGEWVGDRLGGLPKEERREILASSGVCGAATGLEFVPLTRTLRATNAGRAMADAYGIYRNEVVLPIFKALSACDQVIVVVDIAEVLHSGVGWKNVTSDTLQRLMDYITDTAPFLMRCRHYIGSTLSTLRLGAVAPAAVKKAVFVASQADRVHAEYRQHVGHLLKELAMPAVKKHVLGGRLQAIYVTCAAINCTDSTFNDAGEAVVKYEINKQNRVTAATKVPECFPDEWEPGDFKFPRPPAKLPANRSRPPAQFGLHVVASEFFC